MKDFGVIQQNTPFGCLACCYGMVRSHFDEGYTFQEEDEIGLLAEAFQLDREFYEPFIVEKLVKNFDVQVTVDAIYVKKQWKHLSGTHLDKTIEPNIKILSLDDFIRAVEGDSVAIVLMDKWYLDMYTHFAHWIVVSDYINGDFVVNDPFSGNQIKMGEDKFNDSIDSLKKRLRDSPVLIEIKDI